MERWAASRYWLTRGISPSDTPSLSRPLFTIHQPSRPYVHVCQERLAHVCTHWCSVSHLLPTQTHLEEDQSSVDDQSGLECTSHPPFCPEVHWGEEEQEPSSPPPHPMSILHVEDALEAIQGQVMMYTAVRGWQELKWHTKHPLQQTHTTCIQGTACISGTPPPTPPQSGEVASPGSGSTGSYSDQTLSAGSPLPGARLHPPSHNIQVATILRSSPPFSGLAGHLKACVSRDLLSCRLPASLSTPVPPWKGSASDPRPSQSA